MAEPIKASFTFNDHTYHGAYKEHLKHRQKTWIWIRSLLCVAMVGFGAWLMISTSVGEGGRPDVFGSIFITAGSVGFLRPMIWQMWHERNVRKNPAYGSVMHYTFSDQGVTIAGNKGKFEIAKEDVFQLVVTKKGVLLYQTAKSYLWIPKVAFKEGEMDQLASYW